MKQLIITEKPSVAINIAIQTFFQEQIICVSLLRKTSNIINQIAQKVNSTDKIYDNEIKEIQNHKSKLWKKINQIVLLVTELNT